MLDVEYPAEYAGHVDVVVGNVRNVLGGLEEFARQIVRDDVGGARLVRRKALDRKLHLVQLPLSLGVAYGSAVIWAHEGAPHAAAETPSPLQDVDEVRQVHDDVVVRLDNVARRRAVLGHQFEAEHCDLSVMF